MLYGTLYNENQQQIAPLRKAPHPNTSNLRTLVVRRDITIGGSPDNRVVDSRIVLELRSLQEIAQIVDVLDGEGNFRSIHLGQIVPNMVLIATRTQMKSNHILKRHGSWEGSFTEYGCLYERGYS